jgi:hypothetical protein
MSWKIEVALRAPIPSPTRYRITTLKILFFISGTKITPNSPDKLMNPTERNP